MAKTIHVVGNKVYIPNDSEVCKHENSNLIIFVGKMSYEPNIVATTFFANHVFPELLQRFPSLRFVIVGANPDKRVSDLANLINVEVTGYVDSVEPYFQKASIVVAPMLTGAGLQNKIIQAMSYGCCVVTTPIGAEGLDISNQEIAVVDGKEQMVAVITDLLLDYNMRVIMGKMARSYVMEHLSETVISKQFWNFMEDYSHQ